MKTRIPYQAALVGVALAIGGCSDSKVAPVDGTVKLEGKPLEGATVTFTPQEGGRPSNGTTDAEGYYKLKYTREQMGAEISKHNVTISTYREGGGYEGDTKGSEEKVPAKYNTQTTLVKEVPPGGATIDFDLDSEGEINTGGYGGCGGGGGCGY